MTDDELLARAVERARALRKLPESTYRVQLHAGFGFRAAAAVVPYLADLGVTHLYCSPYLAARAGSTHGYDVVDPTRLNPELGTQDDYDALLAALSAHGMAHVLDTVPNHVGVNTNDNAWWNDVLAHGRDSKHAKFFDIQWDESPREALRGKVLLPVLGKSYGDALESGELKLVHEAGEPKIAYFDRRFPVGPHSAHLIDGELNGTPGDPASFDKLDALLEAQHYRLSSWRAAPDEINYRRFFDVNDLAAVAQEHQEVFDASHDFTLKLCAQGKVAGLRVDHPDGLYDPKQYLARLQQGYVLALARALTDDPARFDADRLRAKIEQLDSRGLLYVVVEKILAPGEPLDPAWATHGTSGYDFLNAVALPFVDPLAKRVMTRHYAEFTGEKPVEFAELAVEQKRHVLGALLASELHALAWRLLQLAQRDRRSRDFTLAGLTAALRETIAAFPVYRTYVDDAGVSARDAQLIRGAVAEAKRRNPRLDADAFDFAEGTLLGTFGERFGPSERALQRRFAGKFQQVTAPATAKGVEDTAFYRYNRLLALNEVGGEPGHFGGEVADLHAFLADRAANWPRALSALSTHDTKRSEDVRARLAALAELAEQWREKLVTWGDLNAAHRGKTAPDRHEEYALYQTLLGAWPGSVTPDFAARVAAATLKAQREAKLHTTWTVPNESHERATADFIAAILRPGPFLADFAPFADRLARLGRVTALAQAALKLTAPGVPDTYQGTEFHDLSLVDPDNRRPVDYDARRAALAEVTAALDAPDRAAHVRAFADADDGRAKMLLHRQALRARRARPGLFTDGAYVPLTVAGHAAEHVIAFARTRGGDAAVVVVPRLVARFKRDGDALMPERKAWADTRVELPRALRRNYEDAFAGRAFGGAALPVADLFDFFPVAVLLTPPRG